MNTDKEAVLEQLIALLTQANAHVDFKKATANIPFDLVGTVSPHLPYSIWQLTEHVRIAQRDILDFTTNKNYKALQWPNDYWPTETSPGTEAAWQASLNAIEKDKQSFVSLLTHGTADLTEPFPHGEGQNLLREALLLADHTAYHTGQIVLVRKMLGIWD